MIAITHEATTSTHDVNIWANDHELGTCFLDVHGHLRAQAMHHEDQAELDELLCIEYVVQKKRAHRDGNGYTPAAFLTELPRILRGYYAARRVRPQPIMIPSPFAFKRFDPSKIPAMPRRPRQRV